MDDNLDHLAQLHTFIGEPVNEGLRQAFTQSLAKLYFGLLYWEAGRRNHADPAHQRWLMELLDGPEFAYLRSYYTRDLGFRLPSSLYHFRVPDPPKPAFRFDFGSGLPHGLVYVRFRWRSRKHTRERNIRRARITVEKRPPPKGLQLKPDPLHSIYEFPC